MILDFKSNQSAGLNETDVKKVLKQHTTIPEDVTEILHCLNNTRYFCEFFFGEESLLISSIKAIPEDMVENYKAKVDRNSEDNSFKILHSTKPQRRNLRQSV